MKVLTDAQARPAGCRPGWLMAACQKPVAPTSMGQEDSEESAPPDRDAALGLVDLPRPLQELIFSYLDCSAIQALGRAATDAASAREDAGKKLPVSPRLNEMHQALAGEGAAKIAYLRKANEPNASTSLCQILQDLASDEMVVRRAIYTLMNSPFTIPRGWLTFRRPVAFEQLSAAELDEFVAAILSCASRFLPASLSIQARTGLIAANIFVESGFDSHMHTPNPWSSTGACVGAQQVTAAVWVPFFQRRANLSDLIYYNNEPWRTRDTPMSAPQQSIWANMHIACWAIAHLGECGANPDHFDASGPRRQTPCPSTWWTGLRCWLVGCPVCAAGGERSECLGYRKLHAAALEDLGLDESLLDTAIG